jgi:hypothetical protein
MSRPQASPSAPAPGAGRFESGPPAWFARRRSFRVLHERGCFVIPNPWDVGSARYLQHLGSAQLVPYAEINALFQGGSHE